MIPLLLACVTPPWFDAEHTDIDQDGHRTPADCDDYDIRVNPDAVEIWYDGIDQDCDGHDDDQDRDGYDRAEDCDDRNDDAYPGAWETWYDGIDQDCSGDDDHDQDGDGWSVPEDCDDLDPDVHPGAVDDGTDGIDQDCSGHVGADRDQDGWVAPLDCDDTHPGIHPSADEVWYDGVDQDCDGRDDDQDGDGLPLAEDCDDTDAGIRPGAPETCDGRDQDCDGDIDEGLTGPFTFYEDVDEDGYGSGRELVSSTCEAPDGYAYSGGDCNDGDERRSPDAEEICDNGVDDDCDGIAPDCGVVAGELAVVDSEPLDGLVWLDGARIAAAEGVVHIDGRVLARTEVERLVDLGDVDDDGWRDLGLSGAGHVLLGPFDDEPVELLGQSNQIIRAAGDVDGDGFDDVLAGDSLFYGPVTGGLTSPDVTSDGQALAALDTQGDGIAELLFVDGDTASLVYAEWGAVRAGDADWSVRGVLPLAATGDLTGDGYDDLVLATSTHIELYASPLVARTGLVDSLAVPNPNELWTADLHGDGRPEVVVDGATQSWVVGYDERLDGTLMAQGVGGELVPTTAAVWFLGGFDVRRVEIDPAY